ncbi:MAG: hypothetical protein COA79_09690 [Planctomycetota bacterium]|nr:MAG: hypothetical protein COA79_09690 [Planctomycetota bacterium]
MSGWEESVYDDEFYGSQQDGSYDSAKIIMKYLSGKLPITSIVDIGCGRGGWLKAGQENGATRIVGYDGPWVDSKKLLSSQIEFKTQKLDEEFKIEGQFDLAICLEVAEHLEEGRGLNLVKNLCSCADVILFGAAVKGQGGNHHINERLQSYWAKAFKSNGFKYLDVIRPKFWGNADVVWWYKQNSLLYIQENRYEKIKEGFDQLDWGQSPPIDLVHPDCLAEKAKRFSQYEGIINKPTIRFSLGSLKMAIKNLFS